MNNTYGIIRPSLIDPAKDVDMFYHYRPSRSSEDSSFKKFVRITDVTAFLVNSKVESDSGDDDKLPGMYNLNLPVSVFGKKGIYTIYIRPKEITCTIKDIGALAAYPDVKGIVIDMTDVDDNTLFAEDKLTGYRIEYFGSNNTREDMYRLITSNNMCEPVTQNLTSANVNTSGYRFNRSGSLCFITVSPSASPSFKSNSKPYIGVPNQKIVITNTKFDPVMIELEMVDHDIETLSIMSEGNVVRNLDKGLLTHYNFNNEIYKQYEFSTIKDNYTKNSVAEIKIDREQNIDNELDINELMDV